MFEFFKSFEMCKLRGKVKIKVNIIIISQHIVFEILSSKTHTIHFLNFQCILCIFIQQVSKVLLQKEVNYSVISILSSSRVSYQILYVNEKAWKFQLIASTIATHAALRATDSLLQRQQQIAYYSGSNIQPITRGLST